MTRHSSAQLMLLASLMGLSLSANALPTTMKGAELVCLERMQQTPVTPLDSALWELSVSWLVAGTFKEIFTLKNFPNTVKSPRNSE